MKQSFALLVGAMAVVLASTPCHAQPVSVTVKGGLNVATVSFKPEDDEPFEKKSRSGFVAGISVKKPITDMVSIQPELLFSQKGFKLEGEEEGVKISLAGRVNYVEIPILFTVDVPTRGSVRPFVSAGPYLAFKASAKVDVDLSGAPLDDLLDELGVTEDEFIDEAFGDTESISDQIRSTDVGIVVGGGVQVKGATIEARYGAGFKDIQKAAANDPGEKGKNRVFSILFGWSFR